MKISIAIVMFAAACFTVFAQDAEPSKTTPVPAKSIFSTDVGFVSDGYDGRGYVGFIKSATFIDDGPFYYGFGSLFGGFLTTGETFFETGLLAGYNRPLGNTGFDIDVCMDFLATGGRINEETLMYTAEAPALHMVLTLGFPALSDIDGAISVAPVIRPYNLQTNSWDFSRSYIILSIALRFKSYALVERHRWSESISTTATQGGIS